ncbi:MAG: hypothetical protein IPK81_17440 [Rhodospirillales bacterium]|nr:MAG: hypothetical protein IPK81_17440 [Rhodospirillales bacterium]
MSAFAPRQARASTQPRHPRAEPATGEVFHCYALAAEPDPSVLPRALEFIAKRGLLPYRVHAAMEGRDGRELAIDMQVGGLDQMTADHVGACLRQIVGVNAVMMSLITR